MARFVQSTTLPTRRLARARHIAYTSPDPQQFLKYERRRTAFFAKRDRLPYVGEGPGLIYIVVSFKNADGAAFRASDGKDAMPFLAQLRIKGGLTQKHRMERRRMEAFFAPCDETKDVYDLICATLDLGKISQPVKLSQRASTSLRTFDSLAQRRLPLACPTRIMYNSATLWCIPLHLRGAITSRAFASAVGTEATTARSEIKRKLQEGHGKKSDIVVLGRNLAWNNTQEMTDEFWGRMAWLQFFLVDYKAKTSSTRGFWDSVDHDLAERREKAMEHPAETRAALSSVVFEESLKAHINANPLKKKGKPKAGKQMPEWQKVIARSVEEMDKYTLEELAGEEPDLDHENDENQLDPVSSLRSASTGPN
ncbi:hypothetical protein K438DRAFT_1789712 [Mycena galopus ATCC 62051]|nr:hypothetical protein K438DRAFT_1789712 [Mycena galopus ATCC 62051]